MRLHTTVLEAIRRRLDEWKWTHDHLADMAGCHQSTITRLCNGRGAPSVALLAQVLDALELDVRVVPRDGDRAVTRQRGRSAPRGDGARKRPSS